uniref:Uncharacterized protein n=1 Tax=Aegilops tauschii subsp. strangulata TaxID=200361 RepID=A0A453CCH3_AEGTS
MDVVAYECRRTELAVDHLLYAFNWIDKLISDRVLHSPSFAGLMNFSISACGTNDPERTKEMEKQFVDLLNEELKLQQVVAEEHIHHMNATLVEAKRQATLYQREAEKCNAATETCEEAREKSEGAISKERKLTALWERRARELGWQDSRAATTAR